jgi:hypothetical protein
LYQRFPNEFAQSVQRIREKLPLTNECDELIAKNISYEKSEIKRETKQLLYEKYREPNEELRSIVDFSIDDWFE